MKYFFARLHVVELMYTDAIAQTHNHKIENSFT